MTDLRAGFPEWVVTVPLHQSSRRPQTGWPKDRHESKRAWLEAGDWWATGAIGIICGPSGLVVLDLDRKGGRDGLKEIIRWLVNTHRVSQETALGLLKSAGLIVSTKSGGLHLYFFLPSGWPEGLKTTTSNRALGIDTRGRGGLIVGPGSPGYEIVRGSWDLITEAPDWLHRWLMEGVNHKGKDSGAGDQMNKSERKPGRSTGTTFQRASDHIPTWRPLRAANGRVGAFWELLSDRSDRNEEVRVYCPAPDHDDTDPSAILKGGRRPTVRCFGCQRIWRIRD